MDAGKCIECGTSLSIVRNDDGEVTKVVCGGESCNYSVSAHEIVKHHHITARAYAALRDAYLDTARRRTEMMVTQMQQICHGTTPKDGFVLAYNGNKLPYKPFTSSTVQYAANTAAYIATMFEANAVIMSTDMFTMDRISSTVTRLAVAQDCRISSDERIKQIDLEVAELTVRVEVDGYFLAQNEELARQYEGNLRTAYDLCGISMDDVAKRIASRRVGIADRTTRIAELRAQRSEIMRSHVAAAELVVNESDRG